MKLNCSFGLYSNNWEYAKLLLLLFSFCAKYSYFWLRVDLNTWYFSDSGVTIRKVVRNSLRLRSFKDDMFKSTFCSDQFPARKIRKQLAKWLSEALAKLWLPRSSCHKLCKMLAMMHCATIYHFLPYLYKSFSFLLINHTTTSSHLSSKVPQPWEPSDATPATQ